ncbi:hypothetical protein BLNAU_5732 [Blattamonas nauphoetae]|uniref:Uncharacterized protein n=1 Tax=Blattamonas nauphoetae TaxID=2049346 RepID=A0ABQ9Y643_9EUKA|nr:hypothetical protein BLNAU_5732 [Blattamonas nauphoetae]
MCAAAVEKKKPVGLEVHEVTGQSVDSSNPSMSARSSLKGGGTQKYGGTTLRSSPTQARKWFASTGVSVGDLRLGHRNLHSKSFRFDDLNNCGILIFSRLPLPSRWS